jgi:hypothetical protein
LDWAVASAAKADDAAMQATATRTAGVEYFSLAKFLDMFLSRDFITDAPWPINPTFNVDCKALGSFAPTPFVLNLGYEIGRVCAPIL